MEFYPGDGAITGGPHDEGLDAVTLCLLQAGIRPGPRRRGLGAVPGWDPCGCSTFFPLLGVLCFEPAGGKRRGSCVVLPGQGGTQVVARMRTHGRSCLQRRPDGAVLLVGGRIWRTPVPGLTPSLPHSRATGV